jgi:hypothetical protein
MKKEVNSAAESLIKGRTLGEFRCFNCYKRGTVEPGAETCKCPHCGFEWRIVWIDPTFPRIRGPVWDTNKRMAEKEMSKKEEGRE